MFTRRTAVALSFCLAATATAARAQYVAPYNQVAVVLDASISFQLPVPDGSTQGRVPVTEALRVVQRLFAESSATTDERGSAGDDRYLLIAADAASQTIWTGNRKDLAALTSKALMNILAARREFSGCTDYAEAMAVATRALREDQQATNKFLLVFGDLINEPATRDYQTCAARSGEPPTGMDWEALKGASVGFYFVSTDFQLRPNQRWMRALDSHGIRAEFKDMAQTIAQPLVLPPPPQAVYRATAAQVAAAKAKWNRLAGAAWFLVKGLVATVVVFSIALGGLAFIARRRALRRSQERVNG